VEGRRPGAAGDRRAGGEKAEAPGGRAAMRPIAARAYPGTRAIVIVVSLRGWTWGENLVGGFDTEMPRIRGARAAMDADDALCDVGWTGGEEAGRHDGGFTRYLRARANLR